MSFEIMVTKILSGFCNQMDLVGCPMCKPYIMQNFITPFLFVLIAVLGLLSIVAIFYLSITAKSKERLALIEKGMNPNLSRSDFWIQVGIIGGGIGAGLIFSDLIPHSTYGPLFAIMFAGAGLVIYNVTNKSRVRSDK